MIGFSSSKMTSPPLFLVLWIVCLYISSVACFVKQYTSYYHYLQTKTYRPVFISIQQDQENEQENNLDLGKSPYWFAQVKTQSVLNEKEENEEEENEEEQLSSEVFSVDERILADIQQQQEEMLSEFVVEDETLSKEKLGKEFKEDKEKNVQLQYNAESDGQDEEHTMNTNTSADDVDEDEDDEEVAPIVVDDRMVFPFRATDIGADELQTRKRDIPMFTSSVRVDIFKILKSPMDPTLAEMPSPSTTPISSGPFSTILLTKKKSRSGSTDDILPHHTFAFCDRELYDDAMRRASNNKSLSKYIPSTDKEMIEAVSQMGQTTPIALAVTKAFEAYLSQIAWTWGDREASTLSVDFLIAFGNELSTRLDVNHRIRSTKLSEHEVQVLSNEPFCNYVEKETMQVFQNQWT